MKEYTNRYYYDNQVFKMLDIPVKPLPEHYDPQEYGRQLMIRKPDDAILIREI